MAVKLRSLSLSFQGAVSHRIHRVPPTAVEIVEKELEDEEKLANDCKSLDEICEVIEGRLMKLEKYTPDNFKEDLRASSKLLKQKSVSLSVIGQHNIGKSTILNAILGDMYLPQSGMSATSIKVHIQHNPGVHSGYCPGEGCNYKSADANVDRTVCPFLVVKGENDITGCKQICEKLQELNERCRKSCEDGQVIKVSDVVLEAYVPLLAQHNNTRWSVSLVDNPGFGESKEYIQQLADASILISSAYILVTSTKSMDSMATKSFLEKLLEKDKDAFRDGRVLIAITQFDSTYQVPLGETRITEDKACTTMRRIIEDTTGQRTLPLQSVVLPISGTWALSSVMLSGIERYPSKEEFLLRKQQVIRHINNCPEVMHNLTGGQGEIMPLNEMESSKLAAMLHNASHIKELIKRLQVITQQCVHTWCQKVYSNYSCVAQTVRNTLVNLIATKEKEAKKRRSLLNERVKDYESIIRELKDIEGSINEHNCKTLDIWKTIEKAYDEDIKTQTEKLKQCAKNELDTLIVEFQKKCEKKIQSSSKFGPNEFKQEFEVFLKECESRLEEKLNEMCKFVCVSKTITASCTNIGERIGALKTNTNRLCKKPDSRETMPISYATQAQKPLVPPSLGDLKTAAGDKLPRFRLSTWDRIVIWLSERMGFHVEQRGKPVEDLRLSDLEVLFTELPSLMLERCDSHFEGLKQKVVKYFYQMDYCPLVKKRINGFYLDFNKTLKEEGGNQKKEDEEILHLENDFRILTKNCEHVQKLEALLFKLNNN